MSQGPMWRLIRGQGFAYSYNMIPRPNEGLLYLTFYKATNVIGAYNKTKVILVSVSATPPPHIKSSDFV